MRGHDPATPNLSWWFTPGGGLDPGEDAAAAVRREVAEETGLDLTGVDLGPVVLRRTADFTFDGVAYRQQEDVFRIEVAAFVPDASAWTDVERRSVEEIRWWTPAELAATPETVYPEALVALLRRTTRSGWV